MQKPTVITCWAWAQKYPMFHHRKHHINIISTYNKDLGWVTIRTIFTICKRPTFIHHSGSFGHIACGFTCIISPGRCTVKLRSGLVFDRWTQNTSRIARRVRGSIISRRTFVLTITDAATAFTCACFNFNISVFQIFS